MEPANSKVRLCQTAFYGKGLPIGGLQDEIIEEDTYGNKSHASAEPT